MEELAHNQRNNKDVLTPEEFFQYEFTCLKMWFAENYPHDDFVNVATLAHLETIYKQNGRAIRDLIFFNLVSLNEFKLCDKDEVDENSEYNIWYNAIDNETDEEDSESECSCDECR